VTEPKRKTSWMPSNKWWAATITGAAGVGITWADAGHWTHLLTVMAITVASQRGIAYFVPNTWGTG